MASFRKNIKEIKLHRRRQALLGFISERVCWQAHIRVATFLQAEEFIWAFKAETGYLESRLLCKL